MKEKCANVPKNILCDVLWTHSLGQVPPQSVPVSPELNSSSEQCAGAQTTLQK